MSHAPVNKLLLTHITGNGRPTNYRLITELRTNEGMSEITMFRVIVS